MKLMTIRENRSYILQSQDKQYIAATKKALDIHY